MADAPRAGAPSMRASPRPDHRLGAQHGRGGVRSRGRHAPQLPRRTVLGAVGRRGPAVGRGVVGAEAELVPDDGPGGLPGGAREVSDVLAEDPQAKALVEGHGSGVPLHRGQEQLTPVRRLQGAHALQHRRQHRLRQAQPAVGGRDDQVAHLRVLPRPLSPLSLQALAEPRPAV
eukprot:CAMPEP_0176187738 /NCGR_PEP_ID=MMETSP0121_2-20121125/2550_1 /TAXON_ID=160619 /ORGANISM="Kryptoperidinium foliaceum, Strain CCMP 1326" /LENGTH=173 /DNA_ID=CAMNT_0017526283 /DNA_START=1 /DNA_END=518 /DNA_ORIENTATION=-